MACDLLAHNIRINWCQAGVEVEATSSKAVRCRMPPHFQDVHEFVQSLSETGAAVDLEVACKDNVASVVFVVYAYEQARYPSTPPGSFDATQVFAWLVACVFFVQVCLLYTYRDHFHKAYNLHVQT